MVFLCVCVQLSSRLEQVQGNFLRVPLASDVDTARSLLQQHNDMKQSECLLQRRLC